MAQDHNPYAPPSSEQIPEPTQEPEGPRDLSELHKDLWEDTKRLLGYGAKTGILWVVVFAQLLNVALSLAPQLMLGLNQSPFSDEPPPRITGEMMSDFFVIFGIGWVVVMCVQLVNIAMMRPLHRLYFDGSSAVEGIGDALSMGLPKIPRLVGLGIITVIAGLVGTLLCILPGLAVALFAGFPLYVLLTTDHGVFDSIAAGKQLATEYWKPFLVGVGIYIGVYMIASLPMGLISLIPVVGTLLWGVFALVFGSASTFFFTALFCNIEQRKKTREGESLGETGGPEGDDSAFNQSW